MHLPTLLFHLYATSHSYCSKLSKGNLTSGTPGSNSYPFHPIIQTYLRLSSQLCSPFLNKPSLVVKPVRDHLPFHTVNRLQNLPAPHRHRVSRLQVSNPVQHHLSRLVNLSFESWSAKLRSYVSEHWVMPCHVEDEEDTKEVL